MLREFEFDKESHIYRVDGEFCLSTSSVIQMAGLVDYGAVPKSIIDHASWRGTQLHAAIEYYESDGDLPHILNQFAGPLEEVKPYFEAYLRFKDDYQFEPIGELERQLVYQHDGTDTCIGCQIDLRGTIKGGRLAILDAKSSHKQYGAAKKQKHLCWRLQLASYAEGTAFDEQWWQETGHHAPAASDVTKGIVHCQKDGSYEFVEFPEDDSLLWDSTVRLARAKLNHGWKLEPR